MPIKYSGGVIEEAVGYTYWASEDTHTHTHTHTLGELSACIWNLKT